MQDDGKHLEDDPHREEPAQIVGERDAIITAAVLPDPLVTHGGTDGIHDYIPHDHDECRRERLDDYAANCGCALVPFAKDDGGETPSDVTISEVSESDGDGHLKQERHAAMGVVIVPKGEPGGNAQILQSIRDDLGSDKESDDVRGSVAAAPMPKDKDEAEYKLYDCHSGVSTKRLDNDGSCRQRRNNPQPDD